MLLPAGDTKLSNVADMLMGSPDDDDGIEQDSDGLFFFRGGELFFFKKRIGGVKRWMCARAVFTLLCHCRCRRLSCSLRPHTLAAQWPHTLAA